MIDGWWIGKVWEGGFRDPVDVISRNWPGWTGINHDKPLRLVSYSRSPQFKCRLGDQFWISHALLWFCSDPPRQYRVCTYSSVRPLLFTFAAAFSGPTLQRCIVEAIGSVVKRIKNNGMLPVCMIRTSDFIVEESKAIRGSIVWPLLL
jgi:hypothetical protein